MAGSCFSAICSHARCVCGGGGWPLRKMRRSPPSALRTSSSASSVMRSGGGAAASSDCASASMTSCTCVQHAHARAGGSEGGARAECAEGTRMGLCTRVCRAPSRARRAARVEWLVEVPQGSAGSTAGCWVRRRGLCHPRAVIAARVAVDVESSASGSRSRKMKRNEQQRRHHAYASARPSGAATRVM